MLKTVKVKKQMRLDDLIKYIFDSGIEDETYGVTVFNNPSEVRISGSGNIKLNGYINKHTTFTVEVEEEITEDTKFKTLLEINNAGELYHYKNTTISSMSGASSKYFHAIINGKLEKIWEAEQMKKLISAKDIDTAVLAKLNNQLREENEQLKNNNAQLATDLNAKQTEIDNLTAQLNEANSGTQSDKDEIARLEAELIKANETMAAVNAQSNADVEEARSYK